VPIVSTLPTRNLSLVSGCTIKLRATQAFKLDRHHELIYDDPNELIEAGFPGSFLLPLVRVFQSGNGHIYHRRGTIVDEMIGISHAALICAIADRIGVPPTMGIGYSGRGFELGEKIEAIRKVLAEY
jgi:hypothetical protein